jgi:3-demethoxyubiquinol 3-hydroxylase
MSLAGDRALRVNHAGEHGAVSIYKAQIWMSMLRAPLLVHELTDFLAHEMRHRRIFGDELARRGVRRCRSWHLCSVGGFVLGTVTGLMGPRAVAATTVAVEQVVLGHLERQCSELRSADPEAVAAVQCIVDDERRHHDGAALQLGAPSALDRALMAGVRAATESVIWLGMRL